MIGSELAALISFFLVLASLWFYFRGTLGQLMLKEYIQVENHLAPYLYTNGLKQLYLYWLSELHRESRLEAFTERRWLRMRRDTGYSNGGNVTAMRIGYDEMRSTYENSEKMLIDEKTADPGRIGVITAVALSLIGVLTGEFIWSACSAIMILLVSWHISRDIAIQRNRNADQG